MKKNLFTLLALCALSFIPSSVQAGNYPVAPGQEYTSYALPIYFKQNNTYGSITQQIYLASELTDEYASSGADITAIKFYYTASGDNSVAINRDIKVFLMEIPTLTTMYEVVSTGAVGQSMFFADANNKAGTEVYDGEFNIPALTSGSSSTITITFDKAFKWDGNKNIVVTIYDVSEVTNTMPGGWSKETDFNHLKFTICKTGDANPRFLHYSWRANIGMDTRSTWLNNIRTGYGETYGDKTSISGQQGARSYVAKADFTIIPSAAPVAPSTPSNLAASSVGVTTASLSWSAVDGATSYKLFYSADGTIYSELATPSTNSYEWTGLTSGNTYYVKVAATNAVGDSEFSEPISFTTLVPHIHDGITFEPWSNPSAMPTSGNYYLATDVAFGWESSDVTLTGDLNLCLNGHEANLAFFKIVVPNDKTLAIYDNVGGGKITGFVASEVGAFDIYAKALIVVYNGAELDLHQGIIENTYIPDEDGQSYAIYSNGTLHLSGDVLINSNSADIYLYSSNIITIDGAINNSEKHTVWKNGGAFTTGWSTHMSGEDPRDYFESANSARSVCLDGGEASLRLLLTLSESSLNSSISTSSGQLADVNLTRSLVSSQYNTFCLPFALTDAQLQEYFGAGYDLEEFVSSSLEDDILNLSFNKATALEAGKPYLLQPSIDVTNPSFEGVTIGAVSPADQTSDTYISFHGTYRPTELEGGNKNLLFLGAGNELFYPAATANLKAFRAYFELKGDAKKNAPRARIVKKENTATGFETVSGEGLPVTGKKILRNGQLFIIRDGKTYNAQGQLVK